MIYHLTKSYNVLQFRKTVSYIKPFRKKKLVDFAPFQKALEYFQEYIFFGSAKVAREGRRHL